MLSILDQKIVELEAVNAARHRLRAQGHRGYPPVTPEEAPHLFSIDDDSPTVIN